MVKNTPLSNRGVDFRLMGEINACLDVEKYECGLDWATFSSQRKAEDEEEFAAFGYDYLERFRQQGHERKNAHIRDYVGVRVSNTWFVKRPSDGHMLLVASGPESKGLAEEVIYHDIATVPTRLDIAATAKCRNPAPDYPNGIRENIKRVRSCEGKKQRQIMAVFEHKNGATGLTLGSRTSEVYGRVYDWEAKHCGSAQFRLWRHEIEYKAGAARRLWQSYKNVQKPEDVIIPTMAARLEKWAIPCPWLPDKGRLDIVGTKEKTTDEKRLEHLEKVVVPFLKGLCDRGYEIDVARILRDAGLDKIF